MMYKNYTGKKTNIGTSLANRATKKKSNLPIPPPPPHYVTPPQLKLNINFFYFNE